MKRGTKVAVCHDGKWGRRVQGVIAATRRGHHIRVRFPHPATGEPVEFWARRCSFARVHRRHVYQGWAGIDWFMPWYLVIRQESGHAETE